MKKVAIVSSTLRPNGNSEFLAKACERGAKEAGNEVEFISLKGKTVNYCIGCLACQRIGKCVLKDDVNELLETIKNADVLVFATPIYYYEMSGQLKTFLDRLNPLFPTDYKFRKVYMIATAADDGEYVFEKAYNGLLGWVDCVEKARLKGIVTGGGIGGANAAPKHADVMRKAYELGNKL